MACISEENGKGTSAAGSRIKVLNWIAAKFVSMMNHVYDGARRRLPQVQQNEEAGLEATRNKRSAYQGLEDDWDQELNERFGSKGYRGAEHFHSMYY